MKFFLASINFWMKQNFFFILFQNSCWWFFRNFILASSCIWVKKSPCPHNFSSIGILSKCLWASFIFDMKSDLGRFFYLCFFQNSLVSNLTQFCLYIIWSWIRFSCWDSGGKIFYQSEKRLKCKVERPEKK